MRNRAVYRTTTKRLLFTLFVVRVTIPLRHVQMMVEVTGRFFLMKIKRYHHFDRNQSLISRSVDTFVYFVIEFKNKINTISK